VARGILALVSFLDGSERSIVEITADGDVVHAPAFLRQGTPLNVGEGRSYTAALAPDAWGLTIAVGREMEHPVISRYDWSGALVFENVLEDSPPGSASFLARPDGRGGAYVLAPGQYGTSYQHFDAWGRPAVARRTVTCLVGELVQTNEGLERPPIDAGLDASRAPDAWLDPLDAGVELPDAALEALDAAPSEVDAAVEDAPAG
jgi:hypothetical protein